MDSTTPPQAVISPTIDAATVDATRWLITELRADGHSIEQTSEIAAEHLADVVSMYRVQDTAVDTVCVCETGAGVAACSVHKDFDPTDAELEAAWNGPDAPAAHRAAWALHQELHDRSAS